MNAKLIEIRDLRPIDWFSGKRIAIPVEECAECHRCGRRHAIVWTIEVRDALGIKTFDVGSGCGKRAIEEGILPELEKKSVRDAKKSAREKVAAARKAEVTRIAREALELVEAIPYPEITSDRRMVAAGFEMLVLTAGPVSASCKAGEKDLEANLPGQLRRSWIQYQTKSLVERGEIKIPYAKVSGYCLVSNFAKCVSDLAAFGKISNVSLELWG